MKKENLDKTCERVLSATRSRYTERAATVTFEEGSCVATQQALLGTAEGSAGRKYKVVISKGYNPHRSDENPSGTGYVSCTCKEFEDMNPVDEHACPGDNPGPAFKLDPCKHIYALGHRWIHRNEKEKGLDKLLAMAKPTHIEVNTATWVEAESNKAYLAAIAGVNRWWPKSQVVLKDTTTLIALWLANETGITGKPVVHIRGAA